MHNKFLRGFAFILVFCGCSSGSSHPLDSPPPVAEQETGNELDLANLARLLGEVNSAAVQKNEEGLTRLVQFSKHSDYLVRIEALKALSADYFRKSESGFDTLKDAVNDEHWLVRSVAIKALGREPRKDSLKTLETRLSVEQHERVQKYLRASIEFLKRVPTLH